MIRIFGCFTLALLTFTACGSRVESPETVPTAIETPRTESTPTANINPDSPIRKVDFRNFKYTGPDEYAETFTLKDGERPWVWRKTTGISLRDVTYADLTGDGQEEAILVMGVQTGGSAVPGLVFIYASQNGRPKLLWKFYTGDRAEGGLKSITAQNGSLVLELFGETVLARGSWKVTTPKEKRLCDGCLNIYTRSVLKWNGKAFLLSEKPVMFSRDPFKSGDTWRPYDQ